MRSNLFIIAFVPKWIAELQKLYLKFIFSVLFLAMAEQVFCQDVVRFDSLAIGCFNLVNEIPSKFVVNTQLEYERLVNYMHSYRDCGDYDLPKIDFHNKTLLGLFVRASGCQQPRYKQTVIKNDGAFIYVVDIKTFGMCRRGYSDILWVQVDKIEENSLIKFETKYSR
jgi:hypothetical protein